MEDATGLFDFLFKSFGTQYPYLMFALVIMFLFKKQIGVFFDKVFSQGVGVLLKIKNQETIKIIDLEHHPFFSFVDMSLSRTIPNIYFLDVIKGVLLKEFLKIKFTVFRDCALVMVKEGNLKKLSQAEFRFKALESFNKCISESTQQTKDYLSEIGLDESTVKYVLNVFDKYYNPTIEWMEKYIDEYCDSNYTPHNNYKMSNILYVLKMGLEKAVNKGVKSFSEMNGKLEQIDVNLLVNRNK